MVMSPWGNDLTKYYYELTPDCVLNAFESSTDLRATGRLSALNSLENRVYEIEFYPHDNHIDEPTTQFVVAKFYRPNRWSKEQILEEHEFLNDLVAQEIPVIAPIKFPDGQTLHKLSEGNIYYTFFPKKSGRIPDEFTQEQVEVIGRLLARIHAVGSSKKSQYRINLSPESYGLNNLQYLIDNDLLPIAIASEYIDTVRTICDIAAPWFLETSYQRIHGDCHIGNLIQRNDEYSFVDFDDMVNGPCIQDLWLLAPGSDEHSKHLLNCLLDAYQDFHDFDYQSLRLIEPLRALRYIHFSTWIAKRWQDPSFPNAFPNFALPHYWHGQLKDLKYQLALIKDNNLKG